MSKNTITNYYNSNNKLTQKNEVPLTTFSFLLSEMVQYMLSKSNDDKDFDIEEKLSSLGYPIGEKILELCSYKEKNYKRDIILYSNL